MEVLMFHPTRRRFVRGLACAAGLAPGLAAGAPTAARKAVYSGKVVPLAELVARTGGRMDADAAPLWLALALDDGTLHPLIKDGGSRLFFRDPALLNRPMRLTGRLLPGSTLLQVTAVNSVKNGEPHEVFYWCDICSIKRGEKMTCECCGGPMMLREEPVKK
jgi:hypothetical protein